MRDKLLHPATIIATCALLISLGGAGYAVTQLPKNSVGTKQLKKNAVTSAKVKDGSLTGQDFAPGTLTQGPKGETGAKGDTGSAGAAGEAGARGFSAWDVIPSGVTVTGPVEIDTHSPAASGDHSVVVMLPGIAPNILTATNVNFSNDGVALTTDGNANCTGTPEAPTAPPGHVCLYYLTSLRVNSFPGAYGDAVHNGSRRGFRMVINASDVGDLYLYATWAYTAP